jgi:hypothetical protein
MIGTAIAFLTIVAIPSTSTSTSPTTTTTTIIVNTMPVGLQVLEELDHRHVLP